MRRLSRARVVGVGLVAISVALLGLLEPMARPSYELAIAVGLLAPSVVAVTTAWELSTRHDDGFSMLARAVENGALVAAAAYAVSLVHGLRTTLCDLGDGTLLFALGPGIGCLLAGVWGAVASEGARRLRRRRLACLLFGAAGPLGTALFEVSLFYATPVVFAFDPFVGYFSGAIYDTVLSESGLHTYRVASAATLVAVYVAALHLERAGGRLRYRSLGRPGLLAIGAICAAGSVISVIAGPDLGHWQTASTIREELGASRTEGRCELVYDRRIPEDRAALVAQDCHAHVIAIEDWLGAPTLDRVTAFLFHGTHQKRQLMGASGTSVAKPWRAEIYLNDERFPHDVMGHELVHVLAGPFGEPPFDVAGGVIPNPGLIEGIAVAGSPPDSNLDLHHWSAAMREIDVLPSLESLFSLSFFTSASSTSYVAAGSFVDLVHRTYGADVVRRWYGGEPLSELAGKSWPELESDWHAELDSIALDDADLATARRRFDRPSVFGRRCPHEVDEALERARSELSAGDLVDAESQYRRALGLDPSSSRARLGLARCAERRGEAERARRVLEALAEDEDVTQATRDRALERSANLLLRRGRIDEARERYEQARRRVRNEGRRRTLDLMVHYADVPVARQALLALLVGTTHEGPSKVEALDLFARWREQRPKDGTPAYLMARQYLLEGRYALSTAALYAALRKELPVARVRLESLRLLAVTHCAQGRPRRAARALQRFRNHALAQPSRVDYLERLVDRCALITPRAPRSG